MKKLKRLLIIFIFMTGAMLWNNSAVAQPGNGEGPPGTDPPGDGTPPPDPGGNPHNPVPISGIEILLVAGGMLGLRKIRQSKNQG